MSNSSKKPTNIKTGTLESLTYELASTSAQIPKAAQQIVKHSFSKMLLQSNADFVPSYFQLGKISLQWQLFLEKETEDTILFFFKKRTENSLTTNINMSFALQEQLSSPPKEESLKYVWSPPAFIELHPPLQLFSSLKKHRMDDLLWLRLGSENNDLWAIHLKEAAANAEFYFFGNSQTPPKKSSGKKIHLNWFEDFLQSIRAWSKGDLAPPISIDIKRSTGNIKTILEVLTTNFIAVLQKMAISQKTKNNQPLQWLLPYYQLADYDAKIRFRLTDKGELIREAQAELKSFEGQTLGEDLFQLEVQLKAYWQKNRPYIHFKILPPDFLTEGPLYQSFTKALYDHLDGKKAERLLSKIAKELRVKPQVFTDSLAASTNKGFIFRIARGRKLDTQVFVLPIKDKKVHGYLWFQAKFRVDADHQTAQLDKGSIKNLLNKKGQLTNRGVRYFMRMLFHINEWKNKVTG